MGCWAVPAGPPLCCSEGAEPAKPKSPDGRRPCPSRRTVSTAGCGRCCCCCWGRCCCGGLASSRSPAESESLHESVWSSVGASEPDLPASIAPEGPAWGASVLGSGKVLPAVQKQVAVDIMLETVQLHHEISTKSAARRASGSLVRLKQHCWVTCTWLVKMPPGSPTTEGPRLSFTCMWLPAPDHQASRHLCSMKAAITGKPTHTCSCLLADGAISSGRV